MRGHRGKQDNCVRITVHSLTSKALQAFSIVTAGSSPPPGLCSVNLSYHYLKVLTARFQSP